VNHRERLRAALDHKEPDRVPVDLGGMGSTGVMAVAYAKLRRHIGLPEEKVFINDIGQQLAEPAQDLVDLLDLDVLNIERRLPPAAPSDAKLLDFPLCDLNDPSTPPIDGCLVAGANLRREPARWVMLDPAGTVEFEKPDNAYYFDRRTHRLGNAARISDIAAYEWPRPSAESLEKLRSRAMWLRENTDYALMGAFGGQIHEHGQVLRGWAEFMMDLGEGGAFGDYLLDFMCDNLMHNLGLYMEAVGDLLDVIVFGDDLGTQTAPQLSPDLYQETIHPRHKRLYSYVRAHYPGCRVFLHSCGSIFDLIPMLIDEGVQVLNPVQTSATNMDPRELKKRFGRDLVFWGGGLDTQHMLPQGTSEDVRRMALERLEIFAPGGGFVFCQIHNIQANVPPANIIAMYNALREFNSQPPIAVPQM
jgi:uroporphyrinogen decarboxylase